MNEFSLAFFCIGAIVFSWLTLKTLRFGCNLIAEITFALAKIFGLMG